MEAQLMYYYGWTPRQIDQLSEDEFCEAWQNLLWCREQEAKANKK